MEFSYARGEDQKQDKQQRRHSTCVNWVNVIEMMRECGSNAFPDVGSDPGRLLVLSLLLQIS